MYSQEEKEDPFEFVEYGSDGFEFIDEDKTHSKLLENSPILNDELLPKSEVIQETPITQPPIIQDLMVQNDILNEILNEIQNEILNEIKNEIENETENETMNETQKVSNLEIDQTEVSAPEQNYDEGDTVITISPDINPTILETSESHLRGRKNYSTFKNYLKNNFKSRPITSSLKCKCRGCFECFRTLFRSNQTTTGELLRLNKKL